MKKPTVLLVIEGTYPWYRGGVSEWVHQYVSALKDQEFSIVQIATDQYRKAPLQQALYDIPDYVKSFIRIPPPGMKKNWTHEADRWLKDHLEELNPVFRWADLVHVTNTGFAGWLGMQMAERHGKPLILTEHALYWKEVKMGAVALECGYKIPEHPEGKSRISELFENIAGKVYRASDRVISVSRTNMGDQQRMGAKDLRYIPNGVDHSWLKPQKEHNGKLTVGWIGRCAEMKNPLKFLDLVDALEDDARALMMLCDAGEEELKRQVNHRGQEYPNLRIIWNRPAREHIDEMDALCITSHNESQPLVLFEALSRRVLPFGWPVGDVQADHAVIVEENSSPAEFAEVIQNTWKDKGRWRKEVNTRYENVKKSHTWQAIFEQYRTIMGSFLTNR